MKEEVFQHSGKCYHIVDLLVCPKCKSRLLTFSYLAIYAHLPNGDFAWGYSDLFAYCLRCKSVFMHNPVYSDKWRNLYPTGLVPIANSELCKVVTYWFEKQGGESEGFMAVEEDEEFPF